MDSVLFNGVLYVCVGSNWTSAQICNWIVKGMDTDPNKLDEYLESLGIHRSNMSKFNYFPQRK